MIGSTVYARGGCVMTRFMYARARGDTRPPTVMRLRGGTGMFKNGKRANFNYADLRICLSEVPKDLQLSFQTRESGSAAGLSEMWK